MHAGCANRRENSDDSDDRRQGGSEGGRRSATRARPLVVSVLMAAALAGCGPTPTASTRPDPSAVAATPSAEASASPSASAVSAPPPTTRTPAPGTPASSSPSPVLAPTSSAPPTPPAPATVLSMAVATRGGRLDLVRGGPAQEFTVTLRGGNTQAYRHLLLTFQMESLVPEPGDTPGPARSFVLEHQDPATGTWRPAELRVANDLKPYALLSGGAPWPATPSAPSATACAPPPPAPPAAPRSWSRPSTRTPRRAHRGTVNGRATSPFPTPPVAPDPGASPGHVLPGPPRRRADCPL